MTAAGAYAVVEQRIPIGRGIVSGRPAAFLGAAIFVAGIAISGAHPRSESAGSPFTSLDGVRLVVLLLAGGLFAYGIWLSFTT